LLPFLFVFPFFPFFILLIIFLWHFSIVLCFLI
jgi:hypothetical protein